MSSKSQNLKNSVGARVFLRGKKIFWLTIGLVALLLGGFGVFLPILPTTPFILLAAFAFGKSMPAWRRWLDNNRVFGPIITDWEATGAIAPRFKLMASIMMLAALAFSFYLSIKLVFIGIQAVCMLAAFVYIVTRPNGKK